eukprot:Lankesteria_metandrocarpae@DN4941_c0_g1_i5.p1
MDNYHDITVLILCCCVIIVLCNLHAPTTRGFCNTPALAQDPVLNDKIALFIAMAPACKLQCPQQTWVYTRTPIVDSVCTCICIGAYRHYFASMSSVCWLCVVDSSDPRNRKVARAVAVSSLNPQRDKELTLLYPLISSNATLFYLLFGRKSMLSTADTWKRILPSDLWLKLIEWCIHILFSWKISHSSVDDKRRLCAHMYSTTSVKVIHHWFQMLRSLRFEFYNDAAGLSTNGDVVVPQYNLRQIQCKVILLHGGHDTLCNIGYLRMKLRNASYVVVPHYTHLDFLVAKDVESEVYPVVCRAIEDVCPWMLR